MFLVSIKNPALSDDKAGAKDNLSFSLVSVFCRLDGRAQLRLGLSQKLFGLRAVAIHVVVIFGAGSFHFMDRL
jgi:hypothetical protein